MGKMIAQLAVAVLLGASGSAAKRFELEADHSFTGAVECSTTTSSTLTSTSTRFLNTTTTTTTSHSTTATTTLLTTTSTTTSSTTEADTSNSVSVDPTFIDTTGTSQTTTASTTSPPVELTTSTVFTTATRTVTKCPEDVKDCPEGEGPHVITETIPLYTTVCPVTTTNDEHAPAKPTDGPQRETITTVATRTYTISSCPPYVVDCPIGSITSELVTATYCPEDDFDTTTYTIALPTHHGDGSVPSASETECDDFAPSVVPTPVAPVHETTPVEDEDAPFDVSPPAGETTVYGVDTPTKAWNSGFSTATSDVTPETTSPAGPCEGAECPVPVGGSGKIGAGGALSLVFAAAVLLV